MNPIGYDETEFTRIRVTERDRRNEGEDKGAKEGKERAREKEKEQSKRKHQGRLEHKLLLREPQIWVGRQIRATEVILQLHFFPLHPPLFCHLSSSFGHLTRCIPATPVVTGFNRVRLFIYRITIHDLPRTPGVLKLYSCIS